MNLQILYRIIELIALVGTIAIMSIVSIIVFYFIYFFVKSLYDKNKVNKDILDADDEVGKHFIRCIENNELRHILETSKHTKDFPDDKQLQSFEKYSNQEISDALSDICMDGFTREEYMSYENELKKFATPLNYNILEDFENQGDV